MGKNQKINTSLDKLQKFQLNITLIFVISILMVTIFLTHTIMNKTEDVLSSKLMTLIESNSKQLTININSYLVNIERTGALLFADENYYLYDATDEAIDEYDRIQCESLILNRIVDLGLMENYADFGIVYANDHTVGWISNTTQNLFPDGGIYDGFVECITNSKTVDGWKFGVRDNFDRLYYVKRINPNAVLVVSFHLNELNTVFEYPEELEGLTVYLVNEENQILYATDDSMISKTLPQNVTELVGYENNISARNNTIIANSNMCKNEWRVVCTVSNEMIMRDIRVLRSFAFIFSVIIAGLAVVVALIFIKRATKPVDGVVMDLEERASYDKLSGVYNKAYFKERVDNELSKKGEHILHTYVMIDMDNFKCVNDTLGHDYGDKVISRMGSLLKENIHDRAIIGRLGGDEFAFYCSYSDVNTEQLKNRMNLKLDYLMDVFSEEFSEEIEKCKISLSMGVCIMNQETADYDKLYKNSDEALYYSKNHGKNQYNYYKD